MEIKNVLEFSNMSHILYSCTVNHFLYLETVTDGNLEDKYIYIGVKTDLPFPSTLGNVNIPDIKLQTEYI